MTFQYYYNLSGSNRKPLIEAISRILVQPAVYQGAPSFAYMLGGCMVDRNGILSGDGNADSEAVKMLIEALWEQGFVAENAATEGINTEESNAEGTAINEHVPEAATNSNDPNTLTVEVPDTGFTPGIRENLKKIVASKETLLKQAFQADELPIIESEGKIAFPWFTLHDIKGEADAYGRFITAICNMAKTQKRVTATEKPVENAKFSMRLFLIRLGFIGDEYKTARKLLLRNLSGNSSWKSGHAPEHPCPVADTKPADMASDSAPNNTLAEKTDAVNATQAETVPEAKEGGTLHDKQQ